MKPAVKKSPRKVFPILVAVCLAGILISASIMIFEYRQFTRAEDTYRQISRLREITVEGEGRDLVDFTPLWEVNPEVVAWIRAEDTKIDYPVLKARDNGYYMRRLITGEYNIVGSLFMDYRNRGDFSDKNTIIYGHNMKDETMFSALVYYKEKGYYESHPVILLNIPGANFRAELFAGVVVDGNVESARLDFEDDQDFLSYLDLLRSNSTFKSNTVVKDDDSIVTFSTCSYEFNNARYIVCGKIVPLK